MIAYSKHDALPLLILYEIYSIMYNIVGSLYTKYIKNSAGSLEAVFPSYSTPD